LSAPPTLPAAENGANGSDRATAVVKLDKLKAGKLDSDHHNGH